MTAAFGHRWTSAHGDDFASTSGNLWAIELAGMSRAQIQRGIDTTIRASDGWPPVLADFRAACLGVQAIVDVEAILARPPAEWSPFAVLVKRNLDDHQWRMSGPDGQAHLLGKAHARARAHVMSGGKLPEYTPASHQVTREEHEEPPPPILMTTQDAIEACRRDLGIREAPAPPPEHVPPVRKEPEPCVRCQGSRKEPRRPHRDCEACFGSGVERAYNKRFNEDGTVAGGGIL